MKKPKLVELERNVEGAAKVAGWLIDASDEFLFLQQIGDHFFGWLYGRSSRHGCERCGSGEKVFEYRALTLYGRLADMNVCADLSSTASAIASISKQFELVTVHVERLKPDVCYIGVLVGIDEMKVRMRLISPDERLDKRATSFALTDVTRVEGGALYERALLDVLHSETGTVVE